MTSIVKAIKREKPDYIEYLKEISKALNKIVEELAIMNERSLDKEY